MSSYVLGFQDIDKTKIMVVGGKGAAACRALNVQRASLNRHLRPIKPTSPTPRLDRARPARLGVCRTPAGP